MQRTQLTWMLGGAGLIICGVAAVLRSAFPGLLTAGSVALVATVVYAASLTLLAIGLSRDASVVRREPVGVIALTVLALWPIAEMLLAQVLPTRPTPGDPGVVAFGLASLLVPLIAAVVATVQIARGDSVPPPWRWVPLWVLLGVVVLQAIPQAVMVAVGPEEVQNLAGFLIAFGTAAYVLGTAGMGVLAVTLAARLRPTISSMSP